MYSLYYMFSLALVAVAGVYHTYKRMSSVQQGLFIRIRKKKTYEKTPSHPMTPFSTHYARMQAFARVPVVSSRKQKSHATSVS